LEDVDVVVHPPVIAEEEFLRLVIIHFETGWRLAYRIDRSEMKALANDVHDFFSLPLPRAVWEKTQLCRNPRFVRFVKRALKA
jgi:hypothetical protein